MVLDQLGRDGMGLGAQVAELARAAYADAGAGTVAQREVAASWLTAHPL